MNFQVNLIMDSERRSASIFNLKAFVRVLSVVGPAAMAVTVAMAVIDYVQVSLELDRLRAEWAATEPKKAQADDLRNRVSANQQVLRQLNGIAKSNLPWQGQLDGLIDVTPPDIQLRQLSVSHGIRNEAKSPPARLFSMTIEGKASGAGADRSVSDLKNRLLGAPPFVAAVDTVNVVSYGVDTSATAGRDDRAFRIDCTYSPRTFQ